MLGGARSQPPRLAPVARRSCLPRPPTTSGEHETNLVRAPGARERLATATVGPGEAGLRLDQWLAGRFTYHSRSQWQAAISATRVLVNSQPAKPRMLLRLGDVVLYLPWDHPEPPVHTDTPVLYDDADLLAINKPGDLPCHPGGKYFRHTLWFLWRDRLPDFRLLHRLDRETSGVVLVARTAAAARILSEDFEAGRVHKQYLVLVDGDFPPTLDATGFLGPRAHQVRKQRWYYPSDPGQGEAVSTHFECLGQGGGMSLVRARPATGRQHQIRATLCALGFPVVGDKLYGTDPAIYLRFADGLLTDADRQALRLPRQALHAHRLTVPHPTTGQPLTIVAPIPADLAEALAQAGIAPPAGDL